jgi:ABC-type sugar transport system ATPase subunit
MEICHEVQRPACGPPQRSARTEAANARKAGPGGALFRLLDRAGMQKEARAHLSALGLLTIQNIRRKVETLSGGQRQGVAVVRATAFGSRVVIMDDPTAALGVKESRKVLELILDVKKRGLPIVLISHNMPHVFEVADRIQIHRLGRRVAVIRPAEYSMSDAVAVMTGAMQPRAVAWRRARSGAQLLAAMEFDADCDHPRWGCSILRRLWVISRRS